MRLKGTEIAIPSGWAGIVEDAEPATGFAHVGFRDVPVGVMDRCVNFVRTADGRLAVRNGAQVKLHVADGLGTNASSILTMQRYSQDGAVIVFYEAALGVHYAALYSGDLQTRVIATATNLGWTKAANDPPARPRVVEMFEKLYLTDATRGFADRQPLVAIDAAGALTSVTADFGAGTEAVRPYTAAVYNNVLFISGQDAGQVNAPAMVRHSFLGNAPENAGGFDKDAYNTIGAAGEFITAMVPGRSVLLIAKENELYRLSGFGRALEGWQYAVQPIENTDYLGVKWPGALTFAEGYWYGVAEAGPFRTDGVHIDILVRPRLRSWRDVTAIDQAVVRYDPNRRAILFGFVLAGGTAVQTVWLWDIDAEQWMADWQLPLPVNDVYALATQGLAGPDAAPRAAVLDHSAATLNSIAGSFTPGDTTASTDVWVDKGAGFVKDQTLAPGVTTFTITSLASSTRFPVKLEHAKNGIRSGFSGLAYGYTRLATPQLSASPFGSYTIFLSVKQNADGADLTLIRDNSGVIQVWTAQAATWVSYSDGDLDPDTTYGYTASASRTDWPAVINTSDQAHASARTNTSSMPVPSTPTFDPQQATASTVYGSFVPGDATLQTEVWADAYGTGMAYRFTLDAGVTTFAIPGLNAGTQVPVQLRHLDADGHTSLFSAVGYGYSLLPTPTITSAGASEDAITVHVTCAKSGELVLTRDGRTLADVQSTSLLSFYDTGLQCSNPYTYQAYLKRSDWPDPINTSATQTTSLSTAECGSGGGGL